MFSKMNRTREFQRSLHHWYTRGCLYRFLPEQWATKTRDTGIYRVNASPGAAKLPTAAQRDNEHEKRIKIQGVSKVGEILNEGGDLRGRIVEDGRDKTFVVETERPYFLSSFTLDLTSQLYEDFGDTALVITDIPKFFGRLHNAAYRKGLYPASSPVRYTSSVVVYGRTAISLNPFFDKDIGYKKQKEFRTVLWYAEQNQPHIELDLGNLAAITELIPKRDFSCERKADKSFFDGLSREAMRQMHVR